MELNDITHTIIGAAMQVHSGLGPGLLEHTYKECLKLELISAGLKVEKEVPVPIQYRGQSINIGYRLDLLVEDKVIIELKAVEYVAPIHKMQLLTHLRLSNNSLGLLINFNVEHLRDGVTRLVNNFPTLRKPQRSSVASAL